MLSLRRLFENELRNECTTALYFPFGGSTCRYASKPTKTPSGGSTTECGVTTNRTGNEHHHLSNRQIATPRPWHGFHRMPLQRVKKMGQYFGAFVPQKLANTTYWTTSTACTADDKNLALTKDGSTTVSIHSEYCTPPRQVKSVRQKLLPAPALLPFACYCSSTPLAPISRISPASM